MAYSCRSWWRCPLVAEFVGTFGLPGETGARRMGSITFRPEWTAVGASWCVWAELCGSAMGHSTEEGGQCYWQAQSGV